MTRRVFLLAAGATLIGCKSEPIRYEGFDLPPAGKALLYVYRNDAYIGNTSRVVPKIRVNKDVVGPLQTGGFFRVALEPGVAEVAIYDFDWDDDQARVRAASAVVNVKASAGTTHFVEFSLDRYTFRFGAKPAAVAERILPTLRRLN